MFWSLGEFRRGIFELTAVGILLPLFRDSKKSKKANSSYRKMDPRILRSNFDIESKRCKTKSNLNIKMFSSKTQQEKETDTLEY